MTPDGIDDLCICHEHKPVCDCRKPSDVLSATQLRFLRFLKDIPDYVSEWKHLMRGAQIVATTSKGRKAYVAKSDLDRIIALGFMVPSYGGSFMLTEAGRKI